MDKLLPDDAHELVSHRLHVIIARAPTLDLFEINQFDSKEDLIEAVMARYRPMPRITWMLFPVYAHTQANQLICIIVQHAPRLAQALRP